VLEGITPDTRAILESMCYGGLHSSAVDDMWDLFESLAWHQWQYDDARDSYHHYSYYPYVLFSFCQSFDHDVHSCPYYDISYECHARLSVMIGKIHEQHMRFVSEMRECGLLHGTDPNLASTRLEVSLYEDYESSLPL